MSKQIPLTKGFIAVVDDCDYERASQYHWLAMVRDNTVYAQNGANAKVFKNNTSGYKGVQWHPRSNKWMARICVNYKNIYLGLHVKPMDAAKAYNDAAKIFFGEFANGNAIG